MAAGPGGAGAEVELLVEWRQGAKADALGLVEGDGVSLRRFDPQEVSDPIANGRLLARLLASDGVVVVGLEAASWAARELEGVRIHFAGGVGRIPGATLTARGWTGELPYGAEPLLVFAKAEGWRRLGVLYAPGYEGVARALRESARGMGLSLDARPVAARRDIPRVGTELAEVSDALWLLGDPSLTKGAGFAYLVELSLSRRLPLLAPEAALLQEGAFAVWEPDWQAVAMEAAKTARGIGAAGSWPRSPLALGGGPGRVLVNDVLRRRWAAGKKGGGR